MDNIKVSVVVPVYNIPNDYLERCVNSLLSQTLSGLELIFVNDCSPNPDNIHFLRTIDSQHPHIKIIDLKVNKGVSNARNLGMLAASGEYIGFLDSDDFVDTTMYERLYSEAIAANADMVRCAFREEKRGDVLMVHDVVPMKICLDTPGDYVTGMERFTGAVCNLLVRSALAKDTLFNVNCKHYEDYLFVWQMILRSKVLSAIPDVLYNYCYREGSAARSTITVAKYESLFDSFTQINAFSKSLVDGGQMASVGKYLFYFVEQLSVYNIPIASKIFDGGAYLDALSTYLGNASWFDRYRAAVSKRLINDYRKCPEKFVKSPLFKFGRLLCIYSMYSCYGKGCLYPAKRLVSRLYYKK